MWKPDAGLLYVASSFLAMVPLSFFYCTITLNPTSLPLRRLRLMTALWSRFKFQPGPNPARVVLHGGKFFVMRCWHNRFHKSTIDWQPPKHSCKPVSGRPFINRCTFKHPSNKSSGFVDEWMAGMSSLRYILSDIKPPMLICLREPTV